MSEVKRCVLDETKACINCYECDMCDLDPKKQCDNCMRCLALEDEYLSLPIDELLLEEEE